MELRVLCENLSGITGGYDKVDEIIAGARPKIFDFAYPIFSESYREVLENKILMHFFHREIGLETYGHWKFELRAKMNEVMPYYNKLYESELIEINPIANMHYDKEEQHSGGDDRSVTESNTGTVVNAGSGSNSESTEGSLTRSGENERKNDSKGGNTTQTNNEMNTEVSGVQKTTGSENSTSKYSDTPQGALTNLKENKYLTNATINDGDSEQNSENTTTTKVGSKDKILTTDTRVENEKAGYSDNSNSEGSRDSNSEFENVRTDNTLKSVNDNIVTNRKVVTKYKGTTGKGESELLKEYRETFLNIDMLVINELEELFMQLW